MARRKKKQRPTSPVTQEHFRLLVQFGRSQIAQDLSTREQEKMWQMSCQTARVPFIDKTTVEEEWKRYITGQSKFSGIAINADVDPNYTTVGIQHNRRLTAAHTTKTKALLKKMLEIFARGHGSRESFLTSVELMCRSIADKTF